MNQNVAVSRAGGVPSLRERKQDISLLVGHFLKRAVKQGSPLSFSDEAIATLLAYDWPGNVRELESAVQSAVALSSGPILGSADLPPQIGLCCQPAPVELVVQELGKCLSLRDLEREAILRAVEQARGDKLLAARVLGIGKTTVYRRLREMREEDAETAVSWPRIPKTKITRLSCPPNLSGLAWMSTERVYVPWQSRPLHGEPMK